MAGKNYKLSEQTEVGEIAARKTSKSIERVVQQQLKATSNQSQRRKRTIHFKTRTELRLGYMLQKIGIQMLFTTLE